MGGPRGLSRLEQEFPASGNDTELSGGGARPRGGTSRLEPTDARFEYRGNTGIGGCISGIP